MYIQYESICDVVLNFVLADTPSPARSRKSSALPKKGTLHYVKKEGREDNSTFVIREGTCVPHVSVHRVWA